jgi:hypothetical protein
MAPLVRAWFGDMARPEQRNCSPVRQGVRDRARAPRVNIEEDDDERTAHRSAAPSGAHRRKDVASAVADNPGCVRLASEAVKWRDSSR